MSQEARNIFSRLFLDFFLLPVIFQLVLSFKVIVVLKVSHQFKAETKAITFTRQGDSKGQFRLEDSRALASAWDRVHSLITSQFYAEVRCKHLQIPFFSQ